MSMKLIEYARAVTSHHPARSHIDCVMCVRVRVCGTYRGRHMGTDPSCHEDRGTRAVATICTSGTVRQTATPLRRAERTRRIVREKDAEQSIDSKAATAVIEGLVPDRIADKPASR
jgi:hypothetical protein